MVVPAYAPSPPAIKLISSPLPATAARLPTKRPVASPPSDDALAGLKFEILPAFPPLILEIDTFANGKRKNGGGGGVEGYCRS